MFGFFKNRKEDHKAEINSEHTLTIEYGDNLLNAALKADLPWPHDCRVGSCGTCKCRLIDGKIKPLADFSYVLETDELNNDYILACQTALKTDIEVEVVLSSDKALHHWELDGTIKEITQLTHDIKEVVIMFSSSSLDALAEYGPLYKAGQYADLKPPHLDQARSYSFVNNYHPNQKEFTFYIRHVPGGEFTDWLFKENRTGETLKVTGPYGVFGLVDGDSTINLVAGGSGMSAIICILQEALESKTKRNVKFLFGARKQSDIYCSELIKEIATSWEAQGLGTFEYIPCLSEEPEDTSWQGARGLCVDFIMDDSTKTLSGQQAYLCGPPRMIDVGIDIFKNNGMDESEIFFDKFLDASTMPGGRK